ncbi:MAG: tRNA (adenosine(37)-N6)-dimethylallyltransferase MiaA [Candidatus Omnitrophica bacterium]|nr:tRNA (adenosine(37)-N6)-dimethylallyltransferase MiaA [Candidatus Omnitrophota bacterium]MDD5437044.1 tRNA (adenosine(37)-N6)-dimethylallyltransferase MiaA [Candidatus Omnitrophota bacterium]
MRAPPGKGREKIVFIVGPTAIGKTGLAVKLAKRIGGEIISADSMQVYKGMRILSQSPTSAERRMARHHLVELLDPRKEYSVAAFIKEASRLISSITARGKVPIVAGGSGLYIKGLIEGIFPSPKADLKFRKKMNRFAEKYGSRRLHSKLAKIDPASAGMIHPNDIRRIVRALEIQHTSGKTMTELKASTHGLKEKYDIRIFGLVRPRDQIYSQIDMRADRMFDGRVIEEVKALRRKRLSRTAGAVLGFREICGYLDGRYDLDAAKTELKINTRRFAKRQLTWFRADKRIKWFDLSRMKDGAIIKKIAKGAD